MLHPRGLGINIQYIYISRICIHSFPEGCHYRKLQRVRIGSTTIDCTDIFVPVLTYWYVVFVEMFSTSPPAEKLHSNALRRLFTV